MININFEVNTPILLNTLQQNYKINNSKDLQENVFYITQDNKKLLCIIIDNNQCQIVDFLGKCKTQEVVILFIKKSSCLKQDIDNLNYWQAFGSQPKFIHLVQTFYQIIPLIDFYHKYYLEDKFQKSFDELQIQIQKVDEKIIGQLCHKLNLPANVKDILKDIQKDPILLNAQKYSFLHDLLNE